MYNAAKTPTELLIQTLNLLVVKKPAFESIVIGIGPAVVGMLRTLGASADKFGDKLITLDPVRPTICIPSEHFGLLLLYRRVSNLPH